MFYIFSKLNSTSPFFQFLNQEKCDKQANAQNKITILFCIMKRFVSELCIAILTDFRICYPLRSTKDVLSRQQLRLLFHKKQMYHRFFLNKTLSTMCWQQKDTYLYISRSFFFCSETTACVTPKRNPLGSTFV